MHNWCYKGMVHYTHLMKGAFKLKSPPFASRATQTSQNFVSGDHKSRPHARSASWRSSRIMSPAQKNTSLINATLSARCRPFRWLCQTCSGVLLSMLSPGCISYVTYVLSWGPPGLYQHNTWTGAFIHHYCNSAINYIYDSVHMKYYWEQFISDYFTKSNQSEY